MKPTIALCVCLAAVNVCAAANAGDVLPPPAVYGGYGPPTGWLPPQEVVAMVRATGLKPLHRPGRHGATYMVRALAPTGEEVRVFVDARIGIVRIDPVRKPLYAGIPGPYGPRLVVPGVVPESPYGPPGVVRAPNTQQAAPAALPSPRPKVAAAGVKPAPSPQTAAASEAAPPSVVSPVAETDGTSAPPPATAEMQE